MKNQPAFVKKGEPIKASEYNRIVDNVRRLTPQSPTLTNVKKSRSRAFDVIDTKFEEDKWYIRLKAGFVIDGLANYYVFYQDEDGDNWPIGGIDYDPETFTAKEIYDFKFPWIEVIPDNTLCVNLLDNTLKWVPYEEPFGNCVPITRIDFLEKKLKITNLSPNNVVKSSDHPLKVNVWQKVQSPLEDDPGECDVTVTAGWVFNIKTQSGVNSVDKKMPTDGEDPLNSDPPPIFSDVEYDQVVYLNAKPDEKGNLTDDPEIMVMADGQSSTHYQPAPVATEGDMYYPLAKIKRHDYPNEIVGEFHAYYADQYIFNDLQITSDLVTITNVGEKREVFKTYEAELNEYQFRTLEQLEGTGAVPIIKPLASGTEEGETIPFRYITQRASQEQIHVEETDDGNGVRVRGNNKDFDESNVRKFNIIVKDGLVTTLTNSALSGWWGQVALQFAPKTGSFQTLTLDFEDGSLVDVACSQGVAGSGTENDPGVVNFQFGDT